MTYRQTLHVHAPVPKVFDYFKDPGNWRESGVEGVEFKDVTLTRDGVGTHYTWTARVAGFTWEGFDVFTEFVPGERITDRSSSALEGTWTYTFEPEGDGTRLTVENRGRSIWRFPPLEKLLDRMTARTHGPRLERLKSKLEE